MTEANIQVSVLGEFRVRRGGVDVPMPPSKKTRALLAFLTVDRRAHRRERLCELFWGIPDDPRGSLRWSLSKLRHILDSDQRKLLHADRNAVAVDADAVELDYDVVRGVSPEALSDLDTGRLEEMAAALQGPFLADLHLARCPEFEAWRAYYANETEVLRLKVLRTLIDRLQDDPERALTHALALQAVLPDEDMSREIERLRTRARATVSTAGEPRPGDAPPARPPAPRQRIRFCHAPGGVRIAYSVSGEGPAIVRTAHWMSHLELELESPVWRYWVDALTEGFSLVRYDERLNGLSDQSAEDVSFEALVADLESVIDAAVSGDRFVLLGISQGCSVAVEYAVRHPERVAGLILHGGFVRGWRERGDSSEISLREAMGVLIREGWGQNHPAFRQLFTSLFIPGANRDQMDWFNELQRRTVTPENAWRLSEAFARIDVSEQLSRVTVPTVVLHARGDRLTPLASGLELAERIPGARFVELDSDNHILLTGEPAFQRFFEETLGFAAEVLQPSPTPISSRQRGEATLLCADFVSPVQAFGQLDPEKPLEIIDPLVMQAADLVRDAGGTLVHMSDARLTAAFGARHVLNDHALLACATALRLRRSVTADSHALARLRIALDSGPIILSPPRLGGAPELEVRGAPLTVAQNLNQALRRDLVAITERTRSAAGAALRTRPLARRQVTGFSRGQRLFEVVGLASGDA